jgi:hypothetical protein
VGGAQRRPLIFGLVFPSTRRLTAAGKNRKIFSFLGDARKKFF